MVKLNMIKRVLGQATSNRLVSSTSHRAASSRPEAFDAKGKGKARDQDSAHLYAHSLKLPKTPFGLRADAAKREKLFRKRATRQAYDWQAEQKERPLFVLHDGPPYANGNLHIGHALNKILKDIINRSKLIQGHRIHYQPGWDTHGLPLELKALAVLKKPARSLTPQVIRAAARKEAEAGVQLQRDEFAQFGLMGEWGNDQGYKTMSWDYEKRQLGVVKEMVRKGLITTHHRPTLYSPSSRTALAEAELEYNEQHQSRSVYVAFPLVELGDLEPILAVGGQNISTPVSLAVWTTTAWTLPSNVAIAVSDTMEYCLVQDEANDSLLIICKDRIAAVAEICSTTFTILHTFPGKTLLRTTYSSVLSSSSSRPIISASYVTAASGTGLVHTSPAHGLDDWIAWRAYCSSLSPGTALEDVPCAVDSDGKFSSVLEEMGCAEVVDRLLGKEVLSEGTAEVITILQEKQTLLKEVLIHHKFPYDWRTKKPVIFRATSQWFANLDKIKSDAIKALDNVKFYPPTGAKRLETYVRDRSEWCISRQRAWGVPIPVVYSYPTNSLDPIKDSVPLLTASNIAHIIDVLDQKGTGTDYWWEGGVEEFIEPAELRLADRRERAGEPPMSWRKGTDTLDVWFDSGVSWTLLQELNMRDSKTHPWADVYIEGSDQHRGWFQSSLLTSISSTAEGETPRAPYGTVITHGMVLDDKGKKMSKSLGNVISPLTVINGGKNKQKEPAYGTDVLRLWVASVESSRDVPISAGILSQISETLRKIRNTARFMLGNLNGQPELHIDAPSMGLIERYIMNELYNLDRSSRESYNSYTFNKIYQNVVAFSNTTLSSFYFDIIKDSLYADSADSPRRRDIMFVLQQILARYTLILSPIIPHLAEEIHHFGSGQLVDPALDDTSGLSSVFQQLWSPLGEEWKDISAKAEMEKLFIVRDEVMILMEKARVDKNIGSSVEAEVVLSGENTALVEKHLSILKDLFIVSGVTLHHPPTATPTWAYESTTNGLKIQVIPATLLKCPRCWTFAKPVEDDSDPVCARCARVLLESPL